MTGTPVPSGGQVEGGDSSFENVYIYGNLYYDFGSKDITFNSISMYGNYIQNYNYAEDNDYVRKLGKFYEKL